MKWNFLPLFISSFFILMSISGCGNTFFRYKQKQYSPIRAEINGEIFSADSITFAGSGGYSFHIYSQSFSFNAARKMSDGKKNIDMHICLYSDEPFQLDRKYAIENANNVENFYRKTRFDVHSDESVTCYFVVEGFISFYEYIEGTDTQISGIFEFTAVNENDPSDIMEVKYGVFYRALNNH